MLKKIVLALLFGCCARGGEVQQQAQAQWVSPPNVILIVADDFGITHSSVYGGAYSTPRLDAMANAGLRLTHGSSQPICVVSRVALLSGLYPERTRAIDNNHRQNYTTSLYTMPKAFRDAGYATALVGKWQLGASALDTQQEGVDYGWSNWLAWNIGSAMYYGATYNRDGVDETYNSTVFGPDQLQAYAFDWIDAQTGPWFMYYATPLIHDLNSPMYVAPPGSTATTQAQKLTDMILYMDAQIGALLDHLAAAGIDDETLVLFVGDNGPHCNAVVVKTLNGVPISGCKASLLEGGVRVPMLAYWPTVVEPAVSDRLVDLTDIWPTLAEITGAPLNKVYDGHSFARELAGAYVAPRPWTYVQLGEHPSCYLRGRDYKVYCDGTCVSLANAPFSETVSTDPACNALAGDLASLLDNMTP